MKTFILIAGLPGSGKTHLCRCFPFYIDDPMTLDWIDQVLPDKIVIADSHFCKTQARHNAEALIRCKFPDAEIRWIFYANDPTQCRINAFFRGNLNQVRTDISVLTKLYNVPENAEILPVYR